MNVRGGYPFVWRPENGIDTNGSYMRLPSVSLGIKLRADAACRMYFKLVDFQNDQNGIDVLSFQGTYQFEAPISIREVWIKALDNAAEIEFLSYCKVGL